MESLDGIEQQIQEAIVSVPEKARREEWKGDAPWTREILNRLGKLGHAMGYKVYASRCDEKDGGEWLYDMAWLKYRDGCLLDAQLALESEWDTRRVQDDFEKLLVSRAKHRVMILDAKTQARADKRIDNLVQEIVRCELSELGDRYLFACWVKEPYDFCFRLYVKP
jgi:hypothetical protein